MEVGSAGGKSVEVGSGVTVKRRVAVGGKVCVAVGSERVSINRAGVIGTGVGWQSINIAIRGIAIRRRKHIQVIVTLLVTRLRASRNGLHVMGWE